MSKILTAWNPTAILVLPLFVVGCTLPSSQKNAEAGGGATFAVSTVDGKFTATETQPGYDIPVAKTLSVKVCMLDNQYSRTVQSHKFIIQGGSSDQTLTSDQNGCVVWQEKISYNHLADGANVEVSRNIVASGFQKGSRSISLAVNPWENSVVSLKDDVVSNLIGKDQAANYLTGIDQKTGKKVERSVWMSNATATLFQHQISTPGANYSLELKMAPKIVRHNAAGQPDPVDIKDGKFDVQIALIRVKQISGDKETPELIYAPSIKNQLPMSDGQLTAKFEMKIPQCSSLARYELGVNIVPEGGPEGLLPFHGVFIVGQCEALSGSHAIQLREDPALKPESNATFKLENYLGVQSLSSAVSSVSVENSAVSVTPPQAMSPFSYEGDSQTNKKQYYFLHFCLLNSVSQAPIMNQTVTVTGLNGQAMQTTTANNGCVHVQDYININYFTPECKKQGKVTVDSDDIGLHTSMDVEYKVSADNHVDLSPPGPKDVCAPGDVKISARAYAIDKEKITYSFDEYLTLTVNKSGFLKIIFFLDRPSISLATGANGANLPVGKYLLRWAVLDTNVQDYSKAAGKIFGAGEQEVKVGGDSTMAEDINLALTNIKAIGNTNQILFELVPMSKEIGLMPVTLQGAIDIANDGSGSVLSESKAGPVLQGLIAQFKVDQQQALLQESQLASKDVFPKVMGWDLVNFNEKSDLFAKVDRQELYNWLFKGQKFSAGLGHQLCSYWADNFFSRKDQRPENAQTKATLERFCESNVNQSKFFGASSTQHPEAFFTVERRKILTHPSMTEYLGGFARDLAVSQAFTFGRSYANYQDRYTGWGAVGGLESTINKTPIAVEAVGKVGYTVTDSDQWTQGNSISVTNGLGIISETMTFKLHADDYENCVVLRVNPSAYVAQELETGWKGIWAKWIQKIFDSDPGNKKSLADAGHKPLMLCEGATQHTPLDFLERFYVMTPRIPPTQATNNTDSINRPFFIALRGSSDYLKFVHFIQGNVHIPDSYTDEFERGFIARDPIVQSFTRFKSSSLPGQLVEPPQAISTDSTTLPKQNQISAFEE